MDKADFGLKSDRPLLIHSKAVNTALIHWVYAMNTTCYEAHKTQKEACVVVKKPLGKDKGVNEIVPQQPVQSGKNHVNCTTVINLHLFITS